MAILKKEKKNSCWGFTLIEVLVSVSLLAMLLVAANGMFFTALKGKKKTESLETIKLKGDHALSIMSQMIRNASSVATCDLGMTSIQITNPDGGVTTFSCNGDTIASNSANLVSSYVTSSCQFDCDQADSQSPPLITIDFTLEKGSSLDFLGHAVEQFKTTVSLRSY